MSMNFEVWSIEIYDQHRDHEITKLVDHPLGDGRKLAFFCETCAVYFGFTVKQ